MLGLEIALHNGVKMPVVAYGTSHQGGYSHEAFRYALTGARYSHIDTASRYGSESLIKKDIEALGIPRDQLFLTSKLFPEQYGREKEAFEDSLNNLNTSYLDLYLVHWPEPWNDLKTGQSLKDIYRETWGAFEEFYKTNRCKAIGVSNFEITHLETLLSVCDIKPMVNQIEVHPYCFDKELIDFCQTNGIVVQAYSPLAKGRIFQDEKLHAPIAKIGEKHGRTSAQVMLRWCLQHDIAVVAKSLNEQRVLENISIFDFTLDDGDMQTIDQLSKTHYMKICWEPKSLLSSKDYQ